MSKRLRWIIAAAALMLALAVPGRVNAQGNPDIFGFKFLSGQGVQPIFEGWSHNPEGGFLMWFGYINRNYVETPSIPVGPANNIMPGGPDRGQPSFFNNRIQTKVFSVAVPKDWGPKQELTWSVTVRGETYKAVAWLQPEWEIDPIYDGRAPTAEQKKNKAPAVTLEKTATVALPNALTLTADVSDDGLPVPTKRPAAAVGQETPPTLKPLPDQAEIPVNVPAIPSGGGRRGAPAQGLGVTWTLWRGPAAITFDPAGRNPVKDGKSTVRATFTQPGTYLIRLRAHDGALWEEKDITVTVTGTAPSQ
jgi:hypothetical protein